MVEELMEILSADPWLIYTYHQQKVEDFINELAATEDPNDYGVQREIARSLKINMDDFTDAEIEYIEREVAKRW
jgi:hypothetical protein